MERLGTPEVIQVMVTAAAEENLVLRALLKQAVPMLLRPEAYHRTQRCQLAQNVTLFLEGALDLEDIAPLPEVQEDAYEPGCLSEIVEEPW